MCCSCKPVRHFNPRPPRGGRPTASTEEEKSMIFQSTSSARRTTPAAAGAQQRHTISIHVLREEDDLVW